MDRGFSLLEGPVPQDICVGIRWARIIPSLFLCSSRGSTVKSWWTFTREVIPLLPSVISHFGQLAASLWREPQFSESNHTTSNSLLSMTFKQCPSLKKILFGGTRIWTQCLLARQVLCYLNHTSSLSSAPFCYQFWLSVCSSSFTVLISYFSNGP